MNLDLSEVPSVRVSDPTAGSHVKVSALSLSLCPVAVAVLWLCVVCAYYH